MIIIVVMVFPRDLQQAPFSQYYSFTKANSCFQARLRFSKVSVSTASIVLLITGSVRVKRGYEEVFILLII